MAARALPRALPSRLPPLSRLLVALAVLLADWDTRRRSRHALSRLDTHMLRDIGISTAKARLECAKPFWQD